MRRLPVRSRRLWFWRLLGAAAFATIFAALPWYLYRASGVPRLFELRDEARLLRGRNDALRAENQRLTEKVEALETDPRAIERAARDELGLVYPGERIFELVPEGTP